MTENNPENLNHHESMTKWKDGAKAALKLTGMLLIAAFFVNFSWNMFAPEMFGAAEVRFKQALGLTIFVATIAFLMYRRPQSPAHG